MKCKDDIKKTWEIIKEAIGKTTMINSNLPERCTVNGKSIFDEKKKSKRI